ncbi:MAG: hypothetical protein VKQ33_14440 [Candidatus Sericytochromatia bacterium]|nr:hypothetical protein [Candidatus Sericytochromatia bacterium]
MDAGLPLTVLLAPLVIAAMAVAAMNLVARPPAPGEAGGLPGGEGPNNAGTLPARRAPEGPPKVTLTPARYVGGHPARGAATQAPLVALHRDGLWVSQATRRDPAFSIPWASIEQVVTLDASQMRFGAGAVRGLATDAIPEDRPDALYLRIRHQDERGWWQHTVFELEPGHAEAQAQAIVAAWEDQRPTPPGPGGASAPPPA